MKRRWPDRGTDRKFHYIQWLMGHSSVRTTSVYFHVTRKNLTDIVNPIDTLELPEKPPVLAAASACQKTGF